MKSPPTGNGTREAIFVLIPLPVRKADVDRATFAASVDPEEAFVKVDWKL